MYHRIPVGYPECRLFFPLPMLVRPFLRPPRTYCPKKSTPFVGLSRKARTLRQIRQIPILPTVTNTRSRVLIRLGACSASLQHAQPCLRLQYRSTSIRPFTIPSRWQTFYPGRLPTVWTGRTEKRLLLTPSHLPTTITRVQQEAEPVSTMIGNWGARERAEKQV